jgi:hypothetical protein
MKVYMYCAALVCEDCAFDIMNRLQNTTEDNGDSDTYPQEPYSNGGGESDSPAHCDLCQIFLENPLTTDGYQYILEHYREEWDQFYSVSRGE